MRQLRYPRREPSGRPPGKPKGSNGATRKLQHLTPDEVIPIKPEKCRRCNHKLGEPVSWERHLVQEIPEPQPAKLLEFQKGICICPNCGMENVATDPRCPTKGEFGPHALSLVQDLRFRERLSVAITRRVLRERFGLSVSHGAVLDLTSRTARMLRGAENMLVLRIKRSMVAYVDETGFYINGERVWVWIFVTEHDVLAVIRRSRGSRVPKQILGEEYSGVVVSDCFKAYELLKKQLRKARFQKCWAHLMREAKACAQEYEEGKLIYAEMKGFYRGMKAFLDSRPPPDARTAERQAALAWLDKLLMHEPEEPRVARLLKRLARHREDWFTCMAVPNVEPTNNRAERALRQQVILRRLRGTLRSERGREDHEALTSLIATWEIQGLNPIIRMEKELNEIFEEGEVV